MARLNSFLNQYGFARNISLTLLIASVIVLSSGRRDLAIVAAVMGVGMFYRYLKFFRQYTYEVFITFGWEHNDAA